jgi:hypothetical protein
LSISQLFHKSVKFNVFSSLPPSSIVQFVPARSIEAGGTSLNLDSVPRLPEDKADSKGYVVAAT